MADRIRAWLDHNARAETAQIWSIILIPIWLPVLFVLYHGDNIRRRIRAWYILRNSAIRKSMRE